MKKEKPTLEKLIKLNKTWISRTYTIHGIKNYEVLRKRLKIVFDCGIIINVNNSKTSSSIRHLKNNKFKKICKKCKISDEKLYIFKTKDYSIINRLQQDNKKIIPFEKVNSVSSIENKITENKNKRLNYFIKTINEKNVINNEITNNNKLFEEIEKELILKRTEELNVIYNTTCTNDLSQLERELSIFLRKKGFLEVKTPIIISRDQVEKMGINPEKDKNYKLFCISNNKYLRPMLAPGLYTYLKKLDKILSDPIKIFEIGKCFRRESDTSYHLEEFTMLNFCYMGKNASDEILKETLKEIFEKLDIKYSIINDECKIYGKTIDILHEDLELASSVVGPVPMDTDWGITKKWIGAGIGLERLIKAKKKYTHIKKAEGSNDYYNGIYLN